MSGWYTNMADSNRCYPEVTCCNGSIIYTAGIIIVAQATREMNVVGLCLWLLLTLLVLLSTDGQGKYGCTQLQDSYMNDCLPFCI